MRGFMIQSGGIEEIDGVSIVVPTCRTSAFSTRCLDRLCASAERWRGRKELILGVDRELRRDDPLLQLRDRYPFVRLIRNHGLSGAPRARMVALRHSRFDIVVFTDDDCLVPPDWIRRMVDGARRFGVFTGPVAAADPSDVLEGLSEFDGDFELSPEFENLWRMEEIIDRYRLEAVDSAGRTRYLSFPHLSIRRELLPPVAFDSLFSLSADDMDLGYRLRLNTREIHADRDGTPVRTAYPLTLRAALARKVRHARGIAYVHRRLGGTRLRRLEPGSFPRILFRWIRISLGAPLSRKERSLFLLLNLTYCFALGWYLWRLRGTREFAPEEIFSAVPRPRGVATTGSGYRVELEAAERDRGEQESQPRL